MKLPAAGSRGLAVVVVSAACARETTDDPVATPAAASPDAEAGAPADPRPSLVLLTIDTLRADHLSCYGYYRRTSPFIDSLAAESLLFERCYSTIPHTTPSHASILTGVLPLEHGITANNHDERVDRPTARALVTTPLLRSYAQILRERGWATGGFVSATTAKRLTGLDAGFDAWSEPVGFARAGRETLAEAKRWIAGRAGRPFFLWIHLFDVHGSSRHRRMFVKGSRYTALFPEDPTVAAHLAKRGVTREFPRRGYDLRSPSVTMNARYDVLIRRTDDLVAELVATLQATGAWERTTFVLTSDHGEGLGEHDFVGHGLAWGEQLHVPLIVHVPGRSPARLPQVMSIVDILPTVVDLSPGLPRDELLAQATGASAVSDSFEERPVFSMASSERELALTTSRWKFVRRSDGDEALYDLREDPFELRDVKEDHEEIAASFAARLDASLAEQRSRRAVLGAGGVEPTLSPEEERRLLEDLKELGYAGDDAPDDGDR